MRPVPNDRLIAIREVMERTSLSRSYIYALVKRQEMPAPIKLGLKCSRWSEQAIERWIVQQVG
ncbi:AlpA family phage regulatory protein [Tsuneonella sp. CC-YZS046]|uniref:helix-turn-helix transcriptional regulator n=1 Tax=Tsuneonella sp. CC-YZS046 TaxID=3042152 RepID=UPI002D771640|nr:AlpA family phage regulatory protein [Tsuneonella sp. CC-YZS046]WRO67210.1 AlpA family phage regulatory protein [Tsuneonella sp. CC-YZS046]